MKRFLVPAFALVALAAILLTLSGRAESGDKTAKWFSCVTISDCTVSRGVCGDPQGVNWRHLKDWMKDVRRREVAVDCADAVRHVAEAILACSKGRCVARRVPK